VTLEEASSATSLQEFKKQKDTKKTNNPLLQARLIASSRSADENQKKHNMTHRAVTIFFDGLVLTP